MLAARCVPLGWVRGCTERPWVACICTSEREVCVCVHTHVPICSVWECPYTQGPYDLPLVLLPVTLSSAACRLSPGEEKPPGR